MLFDNNERGSLQKVVLSLLNLIRIPEVVCPWKEAVDLHAISILLQIPRQTRLGCEFSVVLDVIEHLSVYHVCVVVFSVRVAPLQMETLRLRHFIFQVNSQDGWIRKAFLRRGG